MNKKGFTLIELLAVIVILAIIMVIAIPQVLNVIDASEKQAYKESVELMARTAKLQRESKEITNSVGTLPITYTYSNGEQISPSEMLAFKGDKPKSGTITLDIDKDVIIEDLVSKNGRWCASKTKAGEVEVSKCDGSDGSSEKRLYLYKNGTNTDMYERGTSSTCGDTQYYRFNSNNFTINYVDQSGGCTGWAATWTNNRYDLSKYSKAVVEYSSVTITGNGKFVLAVDDNYDFYNWLTESSSNGKLELDLTNCNITSAIDVITTTKQTSVGFNYFYYGYIDQVKGNVDAVITSIYLVEK